MSKILLVFVCPVVFFGQWAALRKSFLSWQNHLLAIWTFALIIRIWWLLVPRRNPPHFLYTCVIPAVLISILTQIYMDDIVSLLVINKFHPINLFKWYIASNLPEGIPPRRRSSWVQRILMARLVVARTGVAGCHQVRRWGREWKRLTGQISGTHFRYICRA